MKNFTNELLINYKNFCHTLSFIQLVIITPHGNNTEANNAGERVNFKILNLQKLSFPALFPLFKKNNAGI